MLYCEYCGSLRQQCQCGRYGGNRAIQAQAPRSYTSPSQPIVVQPASAPIVVQPSPPTTLYVQPPPTVIVQPPAPIIRPRPGIYGAGTVNNTGYGYGPGYGYGFGPGYSYSWGNVPPVIGICTCNGIGCNLCGLVAAELAVETGIIRNQFF